MANQEFFVQRPSINPTIYAYELVDVGTHKGYVKVGYTERDVETRVWEQMHISGVKYRSYSRKCYQYWLQYLPGMSTIRKRYNFSESEID